jgi:hypothetical protein
MMKMYIIIISRALSTVRHQHVCLGRVGVSVCRCVGVSVHWCVGARVSVLCVGALAHWRVGALACRQLLCELLEFLIVNVCHFK